MKIIHVTDSHLAPVGTRYRLPGYEDAIFEKLEYVRARAQEEDALIIHTGDVFDLQNPRGVPRELIYRFGRFLTESQVQWVLIAGQHDYRGRDPSAGRYSPLALLGWHERVTLLSVFDPWCLSVSIPQHGWNLVTIPYQSEITAKLVGGYIEQACTALPNNLPTVLAIHAMITDKEVPWPHIRMGELANLGVDLVLSGDYHAGYGTTSTMSFDFLGMSDGTNMVATGVGTTQFSNPGALARVTYDERARKPQIAVIDLGPPITVNYEEVPHSKGFDTEAASGGALAEERRSEFAERLSQLGFTTDMSWDQIAQGLENEDEQVVAVAREYYEAAKESEQ